jgi:hypothetical protein
MIDYKSLAKIAALGFIQSNKPLNESITKIAEENNLNPQQIQRVCELSNKAVHSYCLLKEADKNFSFELSDAQKVLSSISNSNDTGLLSGFDPERPKAASFEKLNALFDNPESVDIKGMMNKHASNELSIKLSAAIEEVDSRITTVFIKAAEEVQELKDQINQLKMYGIKPEDIRQTLIAADPKKADEVNKLMKTVVPDISGTLAKAPEQAEVQLNPQHPVVIKVHNIFNHNSSLSNLENSRKYLNLCKDKLEQAQV